MAIASLKDSTMMYFSCDVGKFLDSERGLLDVKNYDYESLMGTTSEWTRNNASKPSPAALPTP